jgi:5-methylcytosine-specific restriction endonuclease McrA
MDSWYKARRRVLERDNYRCQMWGSKNKFLHVHHLRRDGTGDDSRLVTLCIDCHEEVHRRINTYPRVDKRGKKKLGADRYHLSQLENGQQPNA